MARTGHLDQRTDGDAGRIHRTEQVTNPVVLGGSGIGAGEDENPLRAMSKGSPDLGAIENEAAVALDGLSLQGGEVRAGIRFGIALAPEFLTGENRTQVPLLLRLGAPMNQCRAEQPDAGSGERDAGSGAFQFL